ncbi:MAG: permease [Actinomycetota bacterium]|nr:permease [Actinomycetota bacterium]
MTGTTAPARHDRPGRPTRDNSAWLALALAAAVWVALFALNRALWDRVVLDLVGLEAGSHFGDAVHFFLYDTVKIGLLLVGVIFAVTVLRTFISVERTRELLGGRRQVAGYALAALLGVATPFCSCSAVPVFIGFVAAGCR